MSKTFLSSLVVQPSSISLLLKISAIALVLFTLIIINTGSPSLVTAQQLVSVATGSYEKNLVAFRDFPDVLPRSGDNIPVTATAYHLHLYQRLEKDPEQFDTFPILAAPVCLAYNTSLGIVRTELSLQELSDWMMGTLTNKRLSSQLEDTPIDISDLTLYLATSSPTTSVILQSMKERGITGWNYSTTAFPSAVLANSNIVFVNSDDDVHGTLKNTTNTTGFLSLALGAGLQCVQMKVFDEVSKEAYIRSPRLPETIFKQLKVDPIAATLVSVGTSYPFVGPVLMSVRKVATCWESRLTRVFDAAVSLAADSSVYAGVRAFGFGQLSAADRVTVLQAIYDVLPCVGYKNFLSGGSSAIQNPASSWILNYVRANRIFIDYDTASITGNTFIQNEQRQLGTTEILFDETDRIKYSHIQFAPALASSISVVYNLPGVNVLVLDKCLLVKIFRGFVRKWNDPEIQLQNPSIELPNATIQRLFRIDDSGSQTVWSENFERLRLGCGTLAISGSISSTTVTGKEALVSTIRENPYYITFMPSSIANDNLLPSASLRDEATGTLTVPSVEFSQNALDNATYDEETQLFKFNDKSDAYPFVGVSYYVYDTNPSKFNCSSVRDAFDFAIWSLTDSTARQDSAEAGFIPLPLSLAASSVEKIRQTKCRGELLYPIPAEEEFPIGLVAGVGAGGLLLLIIILGAVSYWLARRGIKSDKHAVTEQGSTFAIVFTDIQASTTLWSAAPEFMGPALDLHNEIMKRLADKYEGYVPKTVGDSFIIIFAKASNALKFALECQETLHKADWGTDELDIVYARMYGDPDSPFNNETIYQNRLDPDLFNGLCVRIGVHFGTGEIRKEGEMYDYFGNDMNLSARIEACAHGGQIVCSAALIKEVNQIEPAVFDETTITELGRTQLRGVQEPVELFQVLPNQFARRLFPALRLEQTGKAVDEDEDEDTTDYTGTGEQDGHDQSASSFVLSDLGGGQVDISKKSSASTHRMGASSNSNRGGSNNINNSNNAVVNVNSSVNTTSDANTAEGGSTAAGSSTGSNLPADEKFVRFMSLKGDADVYGVRKIYGILKTTLTPFPIDRKKALLQDIIKEWRLPDMRSKTHKQFKQDLGFDIYWLIRIAVKVQNIVAVQKQQENRRRSRRGQASSTRTGDGLKNGTDGTTGSQKDGSNANVDVFYSAASRQSTDADGSTTSPQQSVDPDVAVAGGSISPRSGQHPMNRFSGSNSNNHLQAYYSNNNTNNSASNNNNNNNIRDGRRSSTLSGGKNISPEHSAHNHSANNILSGGGAGAGVINTNHNNNSDLQNLVILQSVTNDESASSCNGSLGNNEALVAAQQQQQQRRESGGKQQQQPLSAGKYVLTSSESDVGAVGMPHVANQ